MTRTGTRKLSDVARHLIVPEGIVSTGWAPVRDQCTKMGIVHDEWQAGLGRAILAKRADGLYAAGIGGVILSIARQVGKTFTIGSIIFALCILFPGLKVLWTAHRSRTSNETFRVMEGLAKRKRVAPHIEAIRRANGQQEVEFKNGSRILFGARESGFGRGFDDVDIEVFDEAQILSQKALDDMVPATNVAANPLIIFMGTPPKPSDPSEVFAGRRRECLSGLSENTLFLEISADDDADPDDRAQWAKANPSYPLRTPEHAILRMKTMLGDESFRREGLGIWSTVAQHSTIPAPMFGKCGVEQPPTEGRVAYGVKFSTDGAIVSLGVCLFSEDALPHVEVVAHRSMSEGTGWLVEWLVERKADAAAIVVDGKSNAGALVNTLIERKVDRKLIVVPTVDQVITAHSSFLNAVKAVELTWFAEQTVLRESVALAGQRPIGTAGGWGWRPLTADGDVGPLECVTLAHFGAVVGRSRRQRTHAAVFR